MEGPARAIYERYMAQRMWRPESGGWRARPYGSLLVMLSGGFSGSVSASVQLIVQFVLPILERPMLPSEVRSWTDLALRSHRRPPAEVRNSQPTGRAPSRGGPNRSWARPKAARVRRSKGGWIIRSIRERGRS